MSVSRCRALLIVVEIDEHKSALCAPLTDPPGPLAQRLVRVVLLVSSAGPMAAHVDMSRGHTPRRGGLMVVRQAQRYVVVAQHLEDAVLVPTAVPELECIAIAGRQHPEKLGEAFAIRFKMAR